MSSLILFIFSNKKRKRKSARLAGHFIAFSQQVNQFNNSTNYRFYLSYDIKSTLKSRF